MARENCTEVSEFILMGLTDHLDLQVPLFMVFLLIYITTLMGNLGMILLIKIDPRLHTPMYYFLINLSFVDVCYSSVITPKMLVNFIAKRKTISFAGCAVQMWFFGLFVATECHILAAMAYDRYVAISNPLLYTTIMSQRICVQLVAGPYIMGLVNAITHTSFTFHLHFCNSSMIHHFFCDIPAMISLSWSDTHINKLVLFALSFVFGTLSGLTVLFSYIYILSAILRIRSTKGRCKAFSTCTSHLTAVIIFFGTLFFIYVRPSSSFSSDRDKVVSVFYTVVIPMLNPLIYSLRNREVKDALCRVMERKMLATGT